MRSFVIFTPDKIKSMRMRCVGYGGGGERREIHTGFWWENLKERDHIEDLGLDGRMILKWV
jgi:hypothetical protein